MVECQPFQQKQQGVNMNNQGLNIYQRINSVMRTVAYVQKDKVITGMGAGYKAVTHDQLVATIRKEVVEAGLMVLVSQTAGLFHEKGKKWDKESKQEVPDTMRLYEGEYDVSLVNIDDPEQRVTVHVAAHALDNGDKAPGKAMTYATKTAMLKLFWLETGENDESRNGPSGIDTAPILLEIDSISDLDTLRTKRKEWANICSKNQDVDGWKEIKAATEVRAKELQDAQP
jgi:hypothetical protein